MPPTKEERREALKQVFHRAQSCTRCPQLAATRTTVVFGSGNADADLMFVGEAPGRHEDEQGVPFVGQAGRLLDRLLAEIGLQRSDVFIANTLKCRPPGNRDPHPAEIESCQEYLFEQLALIRPRVVCTLGNFATKLLRRDPTGITRLHGREEVRVIGPRAVRLYPIFHPAAALYTPANVEVLRADFGRLPELLALPEPPQPAAAAESGPAAATGRDRGPAGERGPVAATGGDRGPAGEREPVVAEEPEPDVAGVDAADASAHERPLAEQLGLF
ncbi:MAG TPA: uracil-DNA glycosylase [Solirubrobacteraceae bacterium]|nr:uracil-DNA glycosylase [Solirubrobacteraceae bacterium]